MSIAERISGANRKRKYELFLRAFKPTATTTILDVGFADKEYSESENYLERHYRHPGNITALGIEEPAEFSRRYPQVKTAVYDGREFPFADGQFDICWSNAVIEHVGDRECQLLFLSEIKRVGRAAFLTTPNRYFPIEVHTRIPLLHMMPKSVFDRAARLVGKGWAAGDYMLLLSLNEIRSLLADAGIGEYTIIKNKMFGFTLDFCICISAKTRKGQP